MKSIIYTLVLWVLLYLQASVSFAQPQTLNKTQIERVMKTGQLWGHLKYFHPYLKKTTTNWEKAFADNIEGVIKAGSQEAFAKAVQQMLDVLDDPLTKVKFKNAKALTSDLQTDKRRGNLDYPVIKTLPDNILFVSIRDYTSLQNKQSIDEKVKDLRRKIAQSKGGIFDLRSGHNADNYWDYLNHYFQAIEKSFSKKTLHYPGSIARYHDGFATEAGLSSPRYHSGTYTLGERWIAPGSNAKNIPFVFILNRQSAIPPVLVALQKAGKAKVMATDPLTDASLAKSSTFELEDGVSVVIRTSEAKPKGRLKVNYLIPKKLSDEQVLKLAQSILKGKKMKQYQFIPEKDTKTVKKAKDKSTKGFANNYYPTLGNRLLAASKIWTVIHYFFAYKDLMENDWNEVFKQAIPRLAEATDSLQYTLAIAKMYKNIEDGHGFIRSRVLRRYLGTASPPIKIQFIEGKPVVTALMPEYKGKEIEVGDIIVAVDGEKVEDRFNRLAQVIAASNQWTLASYISYFLLNGNDNTQALLKIQKEPGGTIKEVKVLRANKMSATLSKHRQGRNDQPMVRLISKDIGYADLDRLTRGQVKKMFKQFKDTKAIIFDMRGYPKATAWKIAPYLSDKRVPAADFRRYSPKSVSIDQKPINMTLFKQSIPQPRKTQYKGITVMLMNESTQSQAEHTGLFFKAANDTKFIGSPTAGANGDITMFKIPGNIALMFSGHDVRHIDGKQLQKVGLKPHVLVKPTIKGIKAGKDEVLEKAIEYVKNKIQK
ncbi:hypothetical protein BKI52_09855 [marine bacterium AO1-C]|nr:hypothetical protein BKI52_09855 [marine bacterium AO1-C]